MMTLAPPVEEVLRRGVLCYVAAPGPDGPHLTPVVFALDGGRLWVTTSRTSRKAGIWRHTPIAAGMIRSAGRAVSFRGEVVAYDLLDPASWARSAIRSPLLARASVRFSRKNLRFFAGYARDAHRVPLSWTPPGRVFLSLDLGSGALLDLSARRPELVWGLRGRRVSGRRRFRARRAGPGPEARLPPGLLRRLGSAGDGAVALEGPDGITVLPVRWARADAEAAYDCVLSRGLLSLVGGGPALRASLVVDRASRWRAGDMEGVQLRGRADVYLPDELSAGRRALLDRAGRAGVLPPDPAILRLRPDRAVWWKGWSSGTVGAT